MEFKMTGLDGGSYLLLKDELHFKIGTFYEHCPCEENILILDSKSALNVATALFDKYNLLNNEVQTLLAEIEERIENNGKNNSI